MTMNLLSAWHSYTGLAHLTMWTKICTLRQQRDTSAIYKNLHGTRTPVPCINIKLWSPLCNVQSTDFQAVCYSTQCIKHRYLVDGKPLCHIASGAHDAGRVEFLDLDGTYSLDDVEPTQRRPPRCRVQTPSQGQG